MPLPISSSQQIRMLFHGPLSCDFCSPALILTCSSGDVLLTSSCQPIIKCQQNQASAVCQYSNLLTALACKYISVGQGHCNSQALCCHTDISLFTILPQAIAVAKAKLLVPNYHVLDQNILAICFCTHMKDVLSRRCSGEAHAWYAGMLWIAVQKA